MLRTLTLGTDGSATWSSIENEKTAPGSYTGGLIYDAPRSRLLSFCGVDSRVYGLNCEVFEMASPKDGFMNVLLDGDLPDPRFGFQYVHDTVNDRVVMFAGQNGNANLAQVGDTWALELVPEGDAAKPRWVRLFESTDGVSKRRNGADAYDPIGRRMFVWGGTSDGAKAIDGLEVLNLDRGHERWTHVDLPANVPPRASGGGVYDPIGKRIVWGFGNSNKGVFTDLYTLRL